MDKEWEVDSVGLMIIKWYLTDLFSAQEKVRSILRQLIQRYGTQAKTAKALNIIRQTMTYRLNHAKVIHLEDALKMLALLQSKKSETEKWKDCISWLTFSEQVRMAWDDFERSRKPRGRKSNQNSQKAALICQRSDENVDTLNQKKKRLDDFIAKKYGFGNRTTFWRAVRVMESRCPLLIQALDDNVIKIRKAFFLLAQPVEVRKQLLQKERLKQKNKKQRQYFNPEKADYQPVLQAFKSDAVLNAMEQRAKEPMIKSY